MIRKLIIILTLSLSPLLFFQPALATVDCSNPTSTQDALSCGANNGSPNSDTASAGAADSLSNTIRSIINVMSLAVAVISVIMIAIGALRLVTSGGNQDAVSGAKKTIIYALVGLVIAGVGQIIVQYVLKKTV